MLRSLPRRRGSFSPTSERKPVHDALFWLGRHQKNCTPARSKNGVWQISLSDLDSFFFPSGICLRPKEIFCVYVTRRRRRRRRSPSSSFYPPPCLRSRNSHNCLLRLLSRLFLPSDTFFSLRAGGGGHCLGPPSLGGLHRRVRPV